MNLMKEICKKSDYIISATGKTHLIDESFLREEKDQILIDV
jgi:5,10-methylene-tetrahydrofolate dehydrogenase/methenyl tetrahydrofolate cyclohydrolase